MGIFSVLPRPVSSLVNPPPGGVPTATQTAHRTPGTPPEYTNTPTAQKRRTTPHRTPHSVHQPTAPTTRQTEPQHRTRAAIQDYILQQPGRSSRPQGSPNGDPQTAPQRAGTPPGCNGVAPQTETPTAAHRRHRGQKKTPRAEARSVAPYLFIFNRSERTTNGKIKMQSNINLFTPPFY